MKKLIWILVMISSFVCFATVSAGEGAGGAVYDKDGNRIGYMKPSEFNDGRFELYDEHWNRTGYIRRNRLEPDRYDIFDKNWERKGYLEKSDGQWERQDNDRR